MKPSYIKTQMGFMPGDKLAQEKFDKTKTGEVVHGDLTRMRNPKFHRKVMALFNLSFEYWEPGEINSKFGVPQKNFDRFRKDLTILAGYFEVVIRVDGSTRVEAKSISFANMEEDEFQALFQALITVCLEKIPILKKMGPEEIDKLTDRVLSFA